MVPHLITEDNLHEHKMAMAMAMGFVQLLDFVKHFVSGLS